MLELPHTVVGAAIATKVGNPALSLPLALASHFALDLLPHWNPHLNTQLKKFGKITEATKTLILADVIISLVVGMLIAARALPDTTAFSIIILGAFMGVLPDFYEAPYFFLRAKYPFVEKLIRFQKSIQNDVPVSLGLVSQVLILAAAFWWIQN